MKHVSQPCMKILLTLGRLAVGITAALPLGMACGGQTDPDGVMGSETHFLIQCSNECAPGLECIRGACTTPCSDDGACSALSSAAVCSSGPDGSAAAACDVPCATSSDCDVLGSAHQCQAGLCRAVAPLAGDLGSMPAALERFEVRRYLETSGDAASTCDPMVSSISIIVEPSAHQLTWESCDHLRNTNTYSPTRGTVLLSDADLRTALDAYGSLRLDTAGYCDNFGGGLSTLDVITTDDAHLYYGDEYHAGCPAKRLGRTRFVQHLDELYVTLMSIRDPNRPQ
jgi:hypothetical protein